MANRIVLNETSYHGSGAIKEIVTEAKNRGFKKAFVCLVENDVEGAHTALAHAGRKREFATGAWLKENLRFPTHLNLRYDNVAGDDAPIDGAVYTQYALQYESERVGLHGQGAVGQKLVSVTTHVFYVNNTCTTVIAEFNKLIDETEGKDILKNAGLDIQKYYGLVEDRKWNNGEVINTLHKFTDEEKADDVHYTLQLQR